MHCLISNHRKWTVQIIMDRIVCSYNDVGTEVRLVFGYLAVLWHCQMLC